MGPWPGKNPASTGEMCLVSLGHDQANPVVKGKPPVEPWAGGHGEGLRHQVTLVGWAGGFREVIKAITDILLDSEV